MGQQTKQLSNLQLRQHPQQKPKKLLMLPSLVLHQVVEDLIYSHVQDIFSRTQQQALQRQAIGRALISDLRSEFFAVVVKQVFNASFASFTSVGGTQESQQ